MSEGLRAQKKHETRKTISDVATRLFIRDGFEDVTIAEIAAEARVAKMTVTNHFPRKEDLVFDIRADFTSWPSALIHDSVFHDTRELYFEALEEHHVVDLVLPEIKATEPDADEFKAKAKVLKDLVEHHAEEEETEMFPRAKKLMDRTQLVELGQQLADAKASLNGGTKARR